MQQLSLVTPIQLLYHPQLVLRGEVRPPPLSHTVSMLMLFIAMATGDLLHVLWASWHIPCIQHALPISILSET